VRNINDTIDLIKLDIEWGWFDALCSAKEVLKKTKGIVMEFHEADLLKNNPKIERN